MRIVVLLMTLTIPAAASLGPGSGDGLDGARGERAQSTDLPRPSAGTVRSLPGAGDTAADPFIVSALPFADAGTTVGFSNDYDETCPYAGSAAPDVVYAYAAGGTEAAIAIDLCHSGYDTKVYVYEDAVTPGAPLACNDDYYFGPPCYTYSSFLGSVPVRAGHTCYVVIDGYGGAGGAYQLSIEVPAVPLPTGACCAVSGACELTSEDGCFGAWQGETTRCDPNPCPPAPPVECPADALLEVEDNGGCNSMPSVFQPLRAQGEGCATMCGTSWATTSSRDTDWYVSIGTGGEISGLAVAEFPVQYMIIHGLDCAAPAYVVGTGEPGETVALWWTAEAGAEVWSWIGPSVFEEWPESAYLLDVCGISPSPSSLGGACCRYPECVEIYEEACEAIGGHFVGPGTICDPTPCEELGTESTSWGAIKARFSRPDAGPGAMPGGSGSTEAGGAAQRPSAAAGPAGVSAQTARVARSASNAANVTPSGSVPALLGAKRPQTRPQTRLATGAPSAR